MPFYVYILECANKTLYTGITNNLERRLKQHQEGKGGHYTGYNHGVKIRYHETFKTRSEAAKREAQIKGWPRTKKLALITGDKGFLKTASRCSREKGANS
ncbi:GIY-YIG nuclease family protein [Candidatus Margulisiibacteriota bacterium]